MNYLIDYFYGNNDFLNNNILDQNSFLNYNSSNYNLIKTEDNNFSLEVALPGYDKNSIEVEEVKNKLIIKSKLKKDNCDNSDILKSFNLADNIKVKNAKIKNGLLAINLVKIIPDDEKPKLISIN